jgi:hypothetical protein
MRAGDSPGAVLESNRPLYWQRPSPEVRAVVNAISGSGERQLAGCLSANVGNCALDRHQARMIEACTESHPSCRGGQLAVGDPRDAYRRLDLPRRRSRALRHEPFSELRAGTPTVRGMGGVATWPGPSPSRIRFGAPSLGSPTQRKPIVARTRPCLGMARNVSSPCSAKATLGQDRASRAPSHKCELSADVSAPPPPSELQAEALARALLCRWAGVWELGDGIGAWHSRSMGGMLGLCSTFLFPVLAARRTSLLYESHTPVRFRPRGRRAKWLPGSMGEGAW